MDEVKRLNYFHSQFLKAEDFQAEQNYHRFMRQHLNRAFHDWGIVYGLEVTATSTGEKQIVVSPGMALDKEGREIIVPEGLPKTIDLNEYNDDREVLITIDFTEVLDDPASYQTNDELNENDKKYTRTVERPIFNSYDISLPQAIFQHIWGTILDRPAGLSNFLFEHREAFGFENFKEESIPLAIVPIVDGGIGTIRTNVRKQANSLKTPAKVQGPLEITDFLNLQGSLVVNENVNIHGQLMVDGMLRSTHSSGILQIDNALSVSGLVKATAFEGDGSRLTGIPISPWGYVFGHLRYAAGKVEIGADSANARLTVTGNRENYTYAGYFKGNVGIEGQVKILENLFIHGDVSIRRDLTINGILRQKDWRNIPLINGWRRHSERYNPPQYFKDTFGIVHLRGLVEGGNDEIIGVLPEGFRPSHRELHVVSTRFEEDVFVGGYTGDNPHNGFGRVDISKYGDIVMDRGSKRWVSLDGITFRAV